MMSPDRSTATRTRGSRARRPSASFPIASTLAALLLGLAPGPADAGLVLQVDSTSAPSGGAGAFDVVLIDSGGAYNVSGFSVELSVAPSSGVQFTGVTTGTTDATYVFGSLQSPPFSFDAFPTTDFTASDADMTAPGYVTLTAGQTVGIEHVSFAVAPGTLAGDVPVSIVIGDNTQILDVSADILPSNAQDGTITVFSSGVPEPSTLIQASIAAALGLLAVSLRRPSH
jgi:hypothetical protein